jgi:hypothetical protein
MMGFHVGSHGADLPIYFINFFEEAGGIRVITVAGEIAV